MFDKIPFQFLWLLLAVILGIIEGFTMSFLTIWFAIGALFAMVGAIIGLPVYFQFIIFVVASTILLYFTKPIVKNVLKVKTVRTNADKVIGEKAVVIQKIDSKKGMGQVKVRGQVWTARSADDEEIDVDSTVEVQEIAGVKVIVKKLNEV